MRSVKRYCFFPTLVIITTALLLHLPSCLSTRLSSSSHASRAAHINYRGISFDISPDGNSLVFSAKGKGTYDLYLMDLKTGKVKRLTETDAYEIDPRFSPDNRSIIYSARQPAGDTKAPWKLYLLELDSLSIHQLTDSNCADSSPIWTPDGRHVVFLRSCRLRQRPFGDWTWYEPRVHWLDLSTLAVHSTELKIIRSSNFSPVGEFLFQQAHIVGDTIGSPAYFIADFSALEKGTGMYLKAKSRAVSWLSSRIWGEEVQFLADGKRVVFSGENPSDKRYVQEIWVGDLQKGIAQPVTNIRAVILCIRADWSSDWVYFLWTNDPVSFRPELWRVNIRTRKVERVADSALFDNPLHWKRP